MSYEMNLHDAQLLLKKLNAFIHERKTGLEAVMVQHRVPLGAKDVDEVHAFLAEEKRMADVRVEYLLRAVDIVHTIRHNLNIANGQPIPENIIREVAPAKTIHDLLSKLVQIDTEKAIWLAYYAHHDTDTPARINEYFQAMEEYRRSRDVGFGKPQRPVVSITWGPNEVRDFQLNYKRAETDLRTALRAANAALKITISDEDYEFLRDHVIL